MPRFLIQFRTKKFHCGGFNMNTALWPMSSMNRSVGSNRSLQIPFRHHLSINSETKLTPGGRELRIFRAFSMFSRHYNTSIGPTMSARQPDHAYISKDTFSFNPIFSNAGRQVNIMESPMKTANGFSCRASPS